ncbi:zinc finger CCCH domain-containing protein 62-like isoform X3 [Dendrobium catenatum]|uniref:zinc finger CCCH domain-containing protein 62-like isoform X3 n=1 Tax=Dendrobium catenatum TaxID=906689 RepID=UPI0009F38F4D|nr:zinc finger CCCH domain-containing protein 62-like isoform X3 [Dendrobium catenatum]
MDSMALDEAFQEHRCEMEDESGSDEFECADDSDDDPSFGIVEETRSAISKLSIRKPRASRRSKIVDGNLESESERETVGDEIPKLDKKDEKSFEMVEQLIKGAHLEKLTLDQCKVYLRKYGLRLTGNKGILISRIREHQEIIDGCGEKKYPPESFVLNCKGDACLGDVVIFEQNVYEMFSIASRSATGPPCGTRTVAGRIVKESYGVAKQQHTFTIEVLWSKGEKPLPPLRQLLIKGRNLYRIKTMRQRWVDEGERFKVLQEKHGRGAHARYSREIRIQEKEKRTNGMMIKRKNLTGDRIPAVKENQHPHKANVQQNKMLKNKDGILQHAGRDHHHQVHHSFQTLESRNSGMNLTDDHIPPDKENQHPKIADAQQMNFLNNKEHKQEQEVKINVTSVATTHQIDHALLLQKSPQSILGKPKTADQIDHVLFLQHPPQSILGKPKTAERAVFSAQAQSILGKPKTAEQAVFSAQASNPQYSNSQKILYMKYGGHDRNYQTKYHGFKAMESRNLAYVRPHHVHQWHNKAKPYDFHGGHLQHNNDYLQMNRTSGVNHFKYVPLQQQHPEYQRQTYH